MYRILTLLIFTTTVAIFFAAGEIIGDAAVFLASLFAGFAFACSTSSNRFDQAFTESPLI